MEKLQNSVAENDAPRGVKVSISVIYALNFHICPMRVLFDGRRGVC